MLCFHIRAHSNLGQLADRSNASADKLAKIVTLSQVELAQQSHHQNSTSLRKQFGLTREIAHKLLSYVMFACSIFLCLPLRVNPRGLLPNHLWQMGITHVTELDKLQYVHVAVIPIPAS